MNSSSSLDHELVWYASYGSNLSSRRFGCYLAGGRPPGSSRHYGGARDHSPARRDVALELPHLLYFAGDSLVWGGAPAFLDTEPTSSHLALARAYLITFEQFADVVAQENGRSVGSPLSVSHHELVPGVSTATGPGRYENLLCTGQHDGIPVVTFTAPWPMAETTPSAPSAAYLAMLIEGLRESHRLTDEQLVSYLGAAPGSSPELVEASLGQQH